MTIPTETNQVQYDMPDDSAAFELAEAVAFYIHEKKGEEVVILDLRGRSDVCDFFVIATGQSASQVKAIAAAVRDGLAATGQRQHHAEGLQDGRWALLDYFDVVAHVFKPDARAYFQLERLWGDAPQLVIPADHFNDPQVAQRHPEFPVGRFNAPGAGANEPETR